MQPMVVGADAQRWSSIVSGDLLKPSRERYSENAMIAKTLWCQPGHTLGLYLASARCDSRPPSRNARKLPWALSSRRLCSRVGRCSRVHQSAVDDR